MAAPDPIAKEFTTEVRKLRRRFLDQIEPLRPDLFRYCRSLAGNVFDAEDLVQETLLKAFSKLSEMHWQVDNTRAWLFRVASNHFIDQQRKHAPTAMPENFDAPSREQPELSPQIREALSALATRLPAQERVAVLLKDVFDFSLEEIAAQLGTTSGAVKAALNRGRAKLSQPLPKQAAPAAQERVSRKLLDAFCDAFNKRDFERLANLFREDAVADVVGMVYELGRQQIKDGSLHHTLFDEEGEPSAEVKQFAGEEVVILWYKLPEGQRAVRDVLRFRGQDENLAEMRYYYFCPETLAEIVNAMGLPLAPNGYKYG
jgi:RNA polymerase sigma-70 factor (ECF subfamily)